MGGLSRSSASHLWAATRNLFRSTSRLTLFSRITRSESVSDAALASPVDGFGGTCRDDWRSAATLHGFAIPRFFLFRGNTVHLRMNSWYPLWEEDTRNGAQSCQSFHRHSDHGLHQPGCCDEVHSLEHGE